MRKAYVDRIVVCEGGYCGAGSSRGDCEPSLQVWGHCDDGGPTSFIILLRDESGDVVAHSDPLSAQRGDGVLITSKKNQGPPWKSCDLLIPTGGAGGYSLSSYLYGVSDLHRWGGYTWTVEVVASPEEWVMTPDEYPLQRYSLNEWNWDGVLSVPLHVYYDGRQYRCDYNAVGSLPSYGAPSISNISVSIYDNDDKQGYASVSVYFETDVDACGQVFYNVSTGGLEAPAQGCDPFGWSSDVSSPGRQHLVQLDPDGTSLYYNQGVHKEYCFKVMAWPSRYRYVDEARGYSEKRSFSLP